MLPQIVKSIATKKMVYSVVGVSAALAYVQECKNDVVFYTKAK